MSREVVIVAYGRSAVCKSRKGSFAGTHPIEYSAQVLKGVLDKVPQLDRSEIEDVIMGCAVQHGTTSMNIAKSVCARAELPAGHTINRFCSSGLQAIATGANAIACGQGDVIVAGGVESMTDTYAPYPVEFQDAWLNEHAPGAYMGMGMTAENVAERYGITREMQDELACESQRRATAAINEGKFKDEIVPITVKLKKSEVVVDTDEYPKPGTTMEGLAKLRASFKDGGTVTAGNASGMNDASSGVILMSEEKAKELGCNILCRVASVFVAGVDPDYMGIGPLFAIPKACEKAGIEVKDLDLVELNEAFAAQSIAVARDLGFDMSKVNVNGGAIALGHPVGASGCRILVTLLHEMQKRDAKKGLATLCIGGGMGCSTIVERD